jgi:hypothetical protein
VDEEQRAVLVGVVAENDADPAPPQEPRQPFFTVSQLQAPKVLAVRPGRKRPPRSSVNDLARVDKSIDAGIAN